MPLRRPLGGGVSSGLPWAEHTTGSLRAHRLDRRGEHRGVSHPRPAPYGVSSTSVLSAAQSRRLRMERSRSLLPGALHDLVEEPENIPEQVSTSIFNGGGIPPGRLLDDPTPRAAPSGRRRGGAHRLNRLPPFLSPRRYRPDRGGWRTREPVVAVGHGHAPGRSARPATYPRPLHRPSRRLLRGPARAPAPSPLDAPLLREGRPPRPRPPRPTPAIGDGSFFRSNFCPFPGGVRPEDLDEAPSAGSRFPRHIGKGGPCHLLI